ncbi:MAG TPA: plastocyanin/azurin family copper-binding protein [Candidatus Thermoplasmatota archaeon]|jgi:plastocyanin|nr:plastocyanin/azurin family copper-binding protein [Candidatus Thermoplasmatota archaeon]
MRGILLFAAVAVLAAPSVLATDAVHNVSIANFQFSPAILQIAAGDTVVWTNNEALPVVHTATDLLSLAGMGSFDSGDISQGQSFSHTFSEPGLVLYYCAKHVVMIGIIQVQ